MKTTPSSSPATDTNSQEIMKKMEHLEKGLNQVLLYQKKSQRKAKLKTWITLILFTIFIVVPGVTAYLFIQQFLETIGVDNLISGSKALMENISNLKEKGDQFDTLSNMNFKKLFQ